MGELVGSPLLSGGADMGRQVFILDLKSVDAAPEYEAWHRPGRVPQAVLDDIGASGVRSMEIFRTGDRLVMVVETKGEAAATDRLLGDESLAWEALMDHFQKPVHWAAPGVKWQLAHSIFDLSDHLPKGAPE